MIDDTDEVAVDDTDEWRADFLRSMRRLFLMAFVVEVLAIGEMIWQGVWQALPMMTTSLLVLCGGRWLIGKRGQAFLKLLRDDRPSG